MSRHSILEMGNLLMVQERERFLSRLLARLRVDSLESFSMFEAGCSTGYNLRLMVQWGGRPENMAGIDLDPTAVDYCKSHAPEIRIHAGSADAIPEADDSFDLSIAFTLFSSVPDEDIAHGIARELYRITKPGGIVLIYDMRRRSPNRDVHPIGVDDVRRWFPKCAMRAYPVTLAPPLSRYVGRYAPWLYGPLAAIPLLRTHAMYVLRRPARPPED
jgi:SAM-dependent methyltransferase